MTTETWLTPDEYLTSFRADTERLSSLARAVDLSSPVPSCPGWHLRDLLLHCSDVYSHKASVLRLGRAPNRGEWPPGEDNTSEDNTGDDNSGEDAVAWHDQQAEALATLLRETGPAVECWTWFPGEDRTAFWFRRMAHEALIHRVDGELAAGIADAGAGDERLAADGVHEVLTWFAGEPDVLEDPTSDDGSAGAVLVEAGTTRLLVAMPDGGHDVRAATDDDTWHARIVGDPMALDLHLWGRPAVGVQTEGDERVLERLRVRLALAL